MSAEPCLCGDPFCPRCFPDAAPEDATDGDDAKDEYDAFVRQKLSTQPPTGFDNPRVDVPWLFEWQRDIVHWALRRGRAAIFAGTGTGKTREQLAWGQYVHAAERGDVLIFAPLGVAHQTRDSARELGMPVTYCGEQTDVRAGLNITNYERMDRFDPARFAAVILDESGRLKDTDSKTRAMMTERFAATPYRLCLTATPAPNDYTELGNHAEFLGVCTRTEMLATYFVHDGGKTQDWRLKGHAEDAFWKWICSWAIVLRAPSDLGYSDDGFELPPLHQHEHVLPAETFDARAAGTLFPLPARTLGEQRASKRGSMAARVARAVEIIDASPHEPWVAWVELNDEQDALEDALGERAVSIRGTTEPDEKLRLHEQWVRGERPVLITKSSIFGHGMNWQHVAHTVFVGVDHSFERFFQAVRRFWRFRQTRAVHAHLVLSETERDILASLRRKEADAERMVARMTAAMRETQIAHVRGSVRESIGYDPRTPMRLPAWLRSEP